MYLCHDQSCPFNNCKDLKALSFAFQDEFRNSFYINIHEINHAAFEWIESDFSLKPVTKNAPSMEIAVLANKRMDIGFGQGLLINGINLKVVCRYCGKNVFKDPDDDADHPLLLLRI